MSDFAELGEALREPSPIADRYIETDYANGSWPLAQPEFVFVLDAVQRVGAAHFGEKWTGNELRSLKWDNDPVTIYRQHWENALRKARLMKKPPPIPMSLSNAQRHLDRDQTDDEFNEQKLKRIAALEDILTSTPDYVAAKHQRWIANRDAKDRLFWALRWLGDKCRAGTIDGSYRYLITQQMFPMAAELWNGRSDLERWAKSAGYLIFVNGKRRYTELFVSRDQLEREIASLAHSPLTVSNSDLSKLSPDLQLAVRVALELELFAPDVMSDKQVQTAVINAAKNMERPIASTKAKQMSATMRWPSHLFD